MRLLLYRMAGITAILAVAGAVAQSSPVGHALRARPTAIVPNVQFRPMPHRPPRAATVASPAAVPVAQQPALAPAVPAPHITIGSGQWGLINQDRAAAGLPPLGWNACLASIAVQNATRMAAQGFISHANGVTLDLGCQLGLQAGENVGYLSNGINDAQMNAMFMASPEHQANILGPYHDVGVAWVVVPNGNAYIAVEFN